MIKVQSPAHVVLVSKHDGRSTESSEIILFGRFEEFFSNHHFILRSLAQTLPSPQNCFCRVSNPSAIVKRPFTVLGTDRSGMNPTC
ncbi:hypothetical protein TNCV_879191 [Trichonephila clavipes]|nr:hypothetical protein TNCV_879191 [Trichonephila clavipes]